MEKLKTITISKTNALIHASYKLSPLENIILLYCIGHIKSNKKINERNEFTIFLSDLSDMMNTTRVFENLKEAMVRLYNRNIIFAFDPETKTKKMRIRSATRWIILRGYNDEHNAIHIAFSDFIIPYLSELSECYTVYKFAHVMHMKSFYGMRIYELLCSWHVGNEKTVSIEYLRKILRIADDQYPRMFDFKKNVIDKAIADINHANCNLWIKVEYIKFRKSVTHAKLQFGKKNVITLEGKPNFPNNYEIPFNLFLDQPTPRSRNKKESNLKANVHLFPSVEDI